MEYLSVWLSPTVTKAESWSVNQLSWRHYRPTYALHLPVSRASIIPQRITWFLSPLSGSHILLPAGESYKVFV